MKDTFDDLETRQMKRPTTNGVRYSNTGWVYAAVDLGLKRWLRELLGPQWVASCGRWASDSSQPQ
jgi:hypothetical protein